MKLCSPIDTSQLNTADLFFHQDLLFIKKRPKLTNQPTIQSNYKPTKKPSTKTRNQQLIKQPANQPTNQSSNKKQTK